MNKRLIAVFMILLITAALAAPCGAAYAGTDTAQLKGDDGISQTPGWPQGTAIKGDGAIVVEASTGTVLYAKNIYDRFYPASTTKILTTLVALENSELDELVTMSYAADHYVSSTSSRMGLVEGEQLSMEQMLYGIMLESANEATYAVGEHVGGTIAHFIKMMNSKAAALGCERSHFANSHGLHDADHYTCCYDMMLIARAAYENPTFMEITGTPSYAMPATNKNDAKLLTNHHWFLNRTMRYDYCIGGKTGATTEAGYALVTYAKKDGMTLISVVMHAPTWDDVYNDTRNLLEYCFSNFRQYDMSELNSERDEMPSMFGAIELFDEDRTPILSNGEGGVIVLPDNVQPDKAVKTIEYDYDVSLRRGVNRIGTIRYTYEGRQVGEAGIMYYNSSPVMTEAEFNEAWPSYMIPVDTALAAAGIDPNRAPTVPTWDEVVDRKVFIPVVTGILLAAAVIIGGTVYIRHRRRYR